jgi:MurNAc alpha-1-phosphate uridylyltransferase
MKVLILAAGRGERLRPLTERTPKPLVEVGGEPLLGRHLRHLAAAGFQEIVVNTSHLADQIHAFLGDGSQWGLSIQISYEGPEPLETGGGMLHALPLLEPDPFLVVNADVVTDFPFAQLKRPPQGLAEVVLVDNPPWRQGGDFRLQRGRIVERSSDGLTFSGIAVYRPEILADQSPGKFSIVPLLEAAIASGELAGQHYRGLWHDTGTMVRLEAARQDIADYGS